MPTVQQQDAFGRSAAVRRERAALRADLVTGRVRLADLMNDPPPVLDGVTFEEVLRWMRATRSLHSIAVIGRWAARDRINLLQPIGGSSAATRAWVAKHGEWHWRRG